MRFVLLLVLLGFAQGRKTVCKCGWRNTNSERILGGSETGVNEYPMIAGIRNPGHKSPFCGGVIITPVHILTAAHCVIQNGNSPMEVFVGEHDVKNDDESTSTQVIKVKTAISHENYNQMGLKENDVAILLLEKPIKFDQFVGPVCLPVDKPTIVRSNVTVLGWGRTKRNDRMSDKLRAVDLRVVPLSECYGNYPASIPLRKGKTAHICTYSPGKDACQGDSGGPVLWFDTEIEKYTTVGIISFGGECGELTGVNTEVYHFIDWIEEKIEGFYTSL